MLFLVISYNNSCLTSCKHSMQVSSKTKSTLVNSLTIPDHPIDANIGEIVISNIQFSNPQIVHQFHCGSSSGYHSIYSETIAVSRSEGPFTCRAPLINKYSELPNLEIQIKDDDGGRLIKIPIIPIKTEKDLPGDFNKLDQANVERAKLYVFNMEFIEPIKIKSSNATSGSLVFQLESPLSEILKIEKHFLSKGQNGESIEINGIRAIGNPIAVASVCKTNTDNEVNCLFDNIGKFDSRTVTEATENSKLIVHFFNALSYPTTFEITAAEIERTAPEVFSIVAAPSQTQANCPRVAINQNTLLIEKRPGNELDGFFTFSGQGQASIAEIMFEKSRENISVSTTLPENYYRTNDADLDCTNNSGTFNCSGKFKFPIAKVFPDSHILIPIYTEACRYQSVDFVHLIFDKIPALQSIPVNPNLALNNSLNADVATNVSGSRRIIEGDYINCYGYKYSDKLIGYSCDVSTCSAYYHKRSTLGLNNVLEFKGPVNFYKTELAVLHSLNLRNYISDQLKRCILNGQQIAVTVNIDKMPSELFQ